MLENYTQNIFNGQFQTGNTDYSFWMAAALSKKSVTVKQYHFKLIEGYTRKNKTNQWGYATSPHPYHHNPSSATPLILACGVSLDSEVWGM